MLIEEPVQANAVRLLRSSADDDFYRIERYGSACIDTFYLHDVNACAYRSSAIILAVPRKREMVRTNFVNESPLVCHDFAKRIENPQTAW